MVPGLALLSIFGASAVAGLCSGADEREPSVRAASTGGSAAAVTSSASSRVGTLRTLASVDATASAPRSAAGPACVAPLRADPAKTARVRALLATCAEGRAAAQAVAAGNLRLCYGDGIPSTLGHDRKLAQLDSGPTPRETAARVAHLHAHATVAVPWVEGAGGPCAARVERALRAEARAYALEVRLRKLLKVQRPLHAYPFEGAVRSLEREKAEAVVFDFLKQHPEGVGAVPALGADYARRCKAEAR